MNKARRLKLIKANAYLQMSLNIIETVKDEEESVLDNMPENLQYSERAYNMENNVDALEEAIEYLNDAIYSIDEVN